MIATDQVVPVSDFRKHQASVMARLSKGPLYLAQRGTVSAVMLSNRLFDHLLKQLEDKDDLIDALKVELAIARGEDVPEPVDIVELESMIGAS